MNADGRGVTRITGWIQVALLCMAGLGACDSRPSAPETRASYFVQKFITEPQNAVDLRGVSRLAEKDSPETLVDDLQTRSAVSYLRARHRHGAEFSFHIAANTRTASGHKIVNVVVSETAAPVGKDSVVRFQVELRQQNNARVVVRLQSD